MMKQFLIQTMLSPRCILCKIQIQFILVEQRYVVQIHHNDSQQVNTFYSQLPHANEISKTKLYYKIQQK